jgi:hypothetical protein
MNVQLPCRFRETYARIAMLCPEERSENERVIKDALDQFLTACNAHEEMLDALKRLSHDTCDGRDFPDWLRTHLPGIHRAIAKAEGGEQ